MRFSHLLLTILVFALFAPEGLSAPGPYSLWPTTTTIDEAPQLAQKRGKRKKKKKTDDEDAFGPADIDAIDHNDTSGVGIHREHEGTDTPYKAEANMSTDLSFLTITPDGGDAISATIIDLSVEWLFILGHMEVGPDVGYKSVTSAATSETINEDGEPEVVSTEQTQSGFSVGGLFKWNFGNIDRDEIVFFGYGGVAYRSAETKIGDLDAQKSTGTIFRAGGGANIFIDSNIAFNPRAEFRMETDEPDAEGAVVTTTSGVKILVGIAVFI